MYELIILGGGPAGAGAAVYAARKLLKTAIITKNFEGQSVVSDAIFNWIGNKKISGVELAKNLEEHIKSYEGEFLNIFEGEEAVRLYKEKDYFIIKTDKEKEYESKAVIIATGSSRKKLQVQNAEKFEQKGITYCASCDGPMFTGQDVVVVGGGNSGFETAQQLLAYCNSVTLLDSGNCMRAEMITRNKVHANSKFKCLQHSCLTEVHGDKFVNSLIYRDKKTGEEKKLSTDGIFVEIGQIPNTDFAKDLLELDEKGRIVVDPKTQTTSVQGIWAAGDCSSAKYHQNNIAVGDAVKAIEDAYLWLKNN